MSGAQKFMGSHNWSVLWASSGSNLSFLILSIRSGIYIGLRGIVVILERDKVLLPCEKPATSEP